MNTATEAIEDSIRAALNQALGDRLPGALGFFACRPFRAQQWRVLILLGKIREPQVA